MASSLDLDLLKKNIVKSIPHDLLTPINAITGFSQIMLDEPVIAENSSVKDMVNRINANGNKLFDLIKKYLLFVEFELSQVESDMRLTLISEDIIAAIADNVALNYNRRDDIIITSTSVLLDADYRLIEFALFELLDNALKYSEKGESVTVDIIKDIDNAYIKIIDNGCGFCSKNTEPLTLDYILENCCSESKNHGLSLLLIKKILELHKGQLSIEGNSPKGAVVTLTLPHKNI